MRPEPVEGHLEPFRMCPELVAMRPELVEGHLEPVRMCPEPVSMCPEPVEGHIHGDAMSAGRKTSRTWRNVMARAIPFLPLD
jgi:hypothetical protein